MRFACIALAVTSACALDHTASFAPDAAYGAGATHVTDAAYGADAAYGTDAARHWDGPPATWSLVTADAYISLPACAHYVGRGVFVQVHSHPLSMCHHPAPVIVDVEPETRTFRFTQQHWREPGVDGEDPCLWITAQYEQTVYLGTFSEPGTWTIEDGVGGEQLELRIDPALPRLTPRSSGMRGAECNSDADCDSSLVCVSDDRCVEAVARCEEPCSPPASLRTDVAFGDSCTRGFYCRGTGLAVRYCLPRESNECGDSQDCGPGSTCVPDAAVCEYPPELLDQTNVPCRNDTDCEDGLHCVGYVGCLPPGDGAFGRCELLCHNIDARCPDGAWCSSDSTCEPIQW